MSGLYINWTKIASIEDLIKIAADVYAPPLAKDKPETQKLVRKELDQEHSDYIGDKPARDFTKEKPISDTFDMQNDDLMINDMELKKLFVEFVERICSVEGAPKRLLEFIINNPSPPHTIKDLAQQYGLTKSAVEQTLNRLSRKWFGFITHKGRTNNRETSVYNEDFNFIHHNPTNFLNFVVTMVGRI